MTDDALPVRVVLYDGVCGLCDRFVAFLLRADRNDALRYAPLQGETAAKLRARHPEIPENLDTVVFVDEGRVFLRSRAIAQALVRVGGPWKVVAWFRFLPRALTDAIYGIVAKTRYRVFGKRDACRVPSERERGLLLP